MRQHRYNRNSWVFECFCFMYIGHPLCILDIQSTPCDICVSYRRIKTPYTPYTMIALNFDQEGIWLYTFTALYTFIPTKFPSSLSIALIWAFQFIFSSKITPRKRFITWLSVYNERNLRIRLSAWFWQWKKSIYIQFSFD